MPPPRIKHGGPSPRTAARVRVLMDEQGVTVAELAGRCNLTRAALYNFLNGRGTATITAMEAILDALGARWGDLDDNI